MRGDILQIPLEWESCERGKKQKKPEAERRKECRTAQGGQGARRTANYRII